MARYERFTFLVDKKERELIAALAEHLRRSQSDAVRFVVIEAIKTLQDQKSNEQMNICKEDGK
jgi:hypothetical protein